MTHKKSQITSAFKKSHTILMPYFTLGYPDYDTSLEIVKECVKEGADLMELGIPFSDPLTDGPTIQYSTQMALKKGMTVKLCLSAVRKMREDGVQIPLILMGSYNPLIAYGLEKFVKDASTAGVNGFIIADLPPEDAGKFLEFCHEDDLALIFLLSPNSTRERIKLVSKLARGFIYLISVTGVTGARSALPDYLAEFIERVRHFSDLPLAVGFGISNADQVRAVGQISDGVIVGSALIESVRNAINEGKNPVDAAGLFINGLRKGLE